MWQRKKKDVPRELAQRAYWGLAVEDLGLTESEHLENNRQASEIIRRATLAEVMILDPAESLLDSNKIWNYLLDGKVIYRDETHLTIDGGLRLTKIFEAFLDHP